MVATQVTVPLACSPGLLSSNPHAVCIEKVGLDLKKLYGTMAATHVPYLWPLPT